MRRTFAGMTLIELVATIGILGMVTIFALPSFRGLQGRQDMRVAQGTIQSALYRLEQLAIAPSAITQEKGEATDFDILGYGLVFAMSNPSGTTTIANCRVSVTNDFMAVIKFVRFKRDNSEIRPYLAAVDPSSTSNCAINARKFPQDIYVMPSKIVFGGEGSTPELKVNKPWLIVEPLESVGTSVGALSTDATYTNPFAVATPQLAVRHSSIRQNGQSLCYGVTLSRYSQAIQIKSKVGCTNG